MKIKTLPLGPVQANCYLIIHDDGTCLIIDPGEEAGKIEQAVEQEGAVPAAVLLTHAHFDHIGALEPIRARYGIPVYVHESEKDWLQNPDLNGSANYPMLEPVSCRPADRFLQKDGSLAIGPFDMEVRHTPGHSPGSVCYVFHDNRSAIAGDTLFRQGIGRTDLPGGNAHQLLTAIEKQLLSLDPDYRIYPGHGPKTTPQFEMDTNPFLNGF
ncbi:MBL fold metallo-hydrolase [Sporosarcina trichiuri]|uniref:MBL fold metallo-hydrolase n=1 Tax=Sporosarcina trichiuri TaxID=3056445 RepID=UPI0025B562F9|nr:MBL fold metallo-hydrolase [Sporosarcina sp. 0.2-SM1T-5]WJY28462.1 MBL fold metallo-hydrolase [Sporosarcina sp. 0.2-SM1T-5]